MNTFSATTPSNVPFTAKGVTGKVQGIVSDMSDSSGAMNKAFAHLLVSYGNTQISESKESIDFIKTIPAVDKRYILGAIKVFTEEYPETITYNYRYKSVAEQTKGVEIGKDMEVEVNGKYFGFVTPKVLVPEVLEGKDLLRQADYDAAFAQLPNYTANVDNLSEYCYVTVGEIKFRFVRFNGQSEDILIVSEKRDTNTLLLCRKLASNAVLGGDNYTQVTRTDLEDMSAKNLDRLRAAIRLAEGSADTTISFEHPEALLLPASERTVVVDLTTDISFFFPAGRI